MSEEKKFKLIEDKWQKYWAADAKAMAAKDFDERPKKYVLVEFPYPSGSGLHVGHAFSFTGGDVYARFKRMQGYNVLFPMGWDAFGLPTENYAIKMKRKPQEVTKENTDMFRSQMKRLAFSFDWSREVNTTDANYYKWTQWIFIELFKKGLAYKQEMPINWCPSCKIGLANEEVVNGKCERCGSEVSRRNISQWIVKITDYADRLAEGLKDTAFIEKVKLAQVNWIGKSEGAKIRFVIARKSVQQIDEAIPNEIATSSTSPRDDVDFLEVFTTRPDTLYGATFMVIAPEHPLVAKIVETPDLASLPTKEIEDYVKQSRKKSDMERTDLAKDKTGVFSGLYAINPVNNKEIPIWISDFVLASYGTGAIMSVPAHDERDFAFAKKFNLPITPVVMPQRPYIDDNAKNYYEKRQRKNWEIINKLTQLAKDNDKKIMINGGWAAVIQVGYEYRECEDIDISILKTEKEWWNNELRKMEFEIGPIFGQDNPDVYYQAVNKPKEEVDTHIDIDVIEETSNYEEVEYQGEKYWALKKEKIVEEKEIELKSGKEKRWKEDADFMMLGHKAYTNVDSGLMINSSAWNGLKPNEAIKVAIEFVKDKGIGEGASSYHLRDWIFSRQHYWGEPIPMIFCETCAGNHKFKIQNSKLKKADEIATSSESFRSLHNDDFVEKIKKYAEENKIELEVLLNNPGWYPVRDEELPIRLPEVEHYEPTDDGRSPLSKIGEFVNCRCPVCGGEAKRETDTMPNWAGSDWYFLRYMDPFNNERLVDFDLLKYWGPVDVYIGGDEHNTLHLLYSRFIYQFLYDLGIFPKNLPEPYYKRVSHGVILGPDNARMSKSKGNVVVPETVVDKYGVDVLRMYLMFMGPFDGTMAWNEKTLMGVKRFQERFETRLIDLINEEITWSTLAQNTEDENPQVKIFVNKTYDKITKDIEQFGYNTAMASLMELLNKIGEWRSDPEFARMREGVDNKILVLKIETVKNLVKLMAPFAPYMAEELWSLIWKKEKGKKEVGDDYISVHSQSWPKADESYLIDYKFKVAVAINGRVRSEIEIEGHDKINEGKVLEIAKNDEKAQQWLLGKKVLREIYVPGKMVNFVVEN